MILIFNAMTDSMGSYVSRVAYRNYMLCAIVLIYGAAQNGQKINPFAFNKVKMHHHY